MSTKGLFLSGLTQKYEVNMYHSPIPNLGFPVGSRAFGYRVENFGIPHGLGFRVIRFRVG